ncbi:MAG: DUF4376 domain-containing protein, partial [Akkermansia sp.]
PTSEQLANYAAACGYKELRVTEAPSPYHTLKYREYDDYITTAWYAPALESLQAAKKAEAQESLDSSLHYARLNVNALGFDVDFNQEAQINVMGMVVMGMADDYTDADNVVHALSIEDIKVIAGAMAAYKKSCHEVARAKRAAIDAAETVEELLNPTE